MFDGRWRRPIDNGLRPVGSALRRTGISADLVTVVGIVMAAACAVAIGTGRFRLALLLLILTGVPDALDGAVAKASGTTSKRGAFFDSVADRLTDALLFGGIAWYLAGRNGREVMLPVALMAAASLVSYQRAKAESLGFNAKGGLMERAERFGALGFGLLFSEFLVPVLWVMLALTAFTAGQRFVKVWRQADRPPARVSRYRHTRRRPVRPMSERWLSQRARFERANRRQRPR
ncbi:MAG: CDP-diacylglycerol---glycerol-3-phosphate 3-phosphatidyltransferase [Acidimicrobiia bacterium]|jgi:CDP-diacylglycerol--glycerol-3-phosphate 3-phosphatidyltransferase|nr:CDP-diacylglycerol---glycerol-3-phosphate 3-phosphatidyltransferase [Acidimicrobiia bacterium]